MAKSIKSLLNKTSWTGAELGKLLLANLMNDIDKNGTDYEPLFSQAEFEKMLDSIKTAPQITAYNVYNNICNFIINYYNRKEASRQQFYHGFFRLFMYLRNAQTAEDAFKKAEDYPLIMTQGEYNELKAKAEDTLKGLSVSFSSILFTLLEDFVSNPAEAPTEIKKAITDSYREPVTNKRILDTYNETMQNGYYILDNGIRSDQLSLDEWQEELKKDFLRKHKLTTNGKDATAEETISYYGQEKKLKGYEYFFKGIEAIKTAYLDITGEEMGEEMDEAEEVRFMEALESNLDIGDYTDRRTKKAEAPAFPLVNFVRMLIDGKDNIEWKFYEEPPADLTKGDILEEVEFYNGADTEDGLPRLKEFKTDYPALYKALEAYIRENIPQAKELKANQLNKDIITWGELAELGFERYKTLITAKDCDIIDAYIEGAEDSEQLLKRRRVLFKGIAIIQGEEHLSVKDGKYIEYRQPLAGLDTIDKITQDEREIKLIIDLRENLIKPALRTIYAFNELLSIISTIYGVELCSAKTDTSIFETQLQGYNNLLYMFYGEVYGTKEEKKSKRELIKEVFQPIEVEELKPRKEVSQEIFDEIASYGLTDKAKILFRNADGLINRLMGKGGF